MAFTLIVLYDNGQSYHVHSSEGVLLVRWQWYGHGHTSFFEGVKWCRLDSNLRMRYRMMMMMMKKLYFHRVAPSAYFAHLPGGPEYE